MMRRRRRRKEEKGGPKCRRRRMRSSRNSRRRRRRVLQTDKRKVTDDSSDDGKLSMIDSDRLRDGSWTRHFGGSLNVSDNDRRFWQQWEFSLVCVGGREGGEGTREERLGAVVGNIRGERD